MINTMVLDEKLYGLNERFYSVNENSMMKHGLNWNPQGLNKKKPWYRC